MATATRTQKGVLLRLEKSKEPIKNKLKALETKREMYLKNYQEQKEALEQSLKAVDETIKVYMTTNNIDDSSLSAPDVIPVKDEMSTESVLAETDWNI